MRKGGYMQGDRRQNYYRKRCESPFRNSKQYERQTKLLEGLRDKEREMIIDEKAIVLRWKEYEH